MATTTTTSKTSTMVQTSLCLLSPKRTLPSLPKRKGLLNMHSFSSSSTSRIRPLDGDVPVTDKMHTFEPI